MARNINLVNDVGAPIAVAAVNIGSRTMLPAYHDWFVYGMSILGYLGAYMGYGGEFVKQVGVSSLPLTTDKLYERFAGGGAVSRSLAMRRVRASGAPVTRSYQREFESVAPHAF